jgi:cation-transporting ATPase E
MDTTVPLTIKGLTDSEAQGLRDEGKGNNIKIKTSRSYGEIIRENLFTSFNLVLFGLGVILIILGSPSDAVITSGVVFINVLVAVFQEIKAKKKLDQIALLTRPKARVMRDGAEKEIDPSDIVLGDTLLLNPGDQVMVDGDIIEGKIEADESLLTGESDNIEKKTGDTVLSGSFCVGGSAYYKADKVGIDCYVNKLSAGAKAFVRELTPLQREIDLLVRILLAVVVFFAILLGLNFIFHQVDILDSVRAASVLFGLAPNSLLLMIVIAYAIGALRISTKGALVQQANSVESLCHVTVLCLDKTGTITANKIKFNEIIPINKTKSIDELSRMLGIFSRSLSASNKTAEAISQACEGEKTTILQEVPFSSVYKWSGATFDNDKLKGTFILGAPEIIMPTYTENPEMSRNASAYVEPGSSRVV